MLEECLDLAQQAPTASYSQNWHFVVVTDAEKRAALGEIWREVAYPYLQRGGGPREGQMLRISEAVVHLAEHIHEVPVHVIPCVDGPLRGQVEPARRVDVRLDHPGRLVVHARRALARARQRAGRRSISCRSSEAAEILGIPYAEVTQVALIPVAYTIGTDFKPGTRKPLDSMVHWDSW